MAPFIQAVEPPAGIPRRGKNYYSVRHTVFEIDSEYVPIKPLGMGSYGVVCSALNVRTGEKVAIKKILDVFGHPTTAVRTLREMMILRQIKHHNVIALKDVMVPSLKKSFQEIYLVYELMDTDLTHVIRSMQPLSGDHIKYFLYQILRGLHHIHSANVLHRDLKPSNILVDADCELKICDFGLSRTTAKEESEFMTEYVVSRWYRAPELLLGSYNYGPSVDMWSVGCIFAELLGRKPIFCGSNSLNQLQVIIDVLGTQKEEDLKFIQSARSRRYIESLPYSSGTPLLTLFPGADPVGLDLLAKMLVFEPNKRITVAKALKHPYLGDWHDPGTERPAQFQVKLDRVVEGMEEKAIRKLMWEEVLYNHPDLDVQESPSLPGCFAMLESSVDVSNFGL